MYPFGEGRPDLLQHFVGGTGPPAGYCTVNPCPWVGLALFPNGNVLARCDKAVY